MANRHGILFPLSDFVRLGGCLVKVSGMLLAFATQSFVYSHCCMTL